MKIVVVGMAVLSESLDVLTGFRDQLYGCLPRRADALFELTDALLCTDGPVETLVGLSLAAEHPRGHCALYDALNHGRIDVEPLRRRLVETPLPRAADGRLVLAVDVSPWLRPHAATSPDRSFCHTYGRGKDEHRMIPGWPYSFIAALETGRTSWTALLDAVRLPPGADLTPLTCAQIRQLVDRLTGAGQWQPGDSDILIVLDAGYEAPRIAWLLRDLPIEILGRMRSDRVLRRPTPPRVYQPLGGRPAKHGGEFVFGDPATWNAEQAATVTDTRRYGQVKAQGWDRLHPRLTRRAAWADHDGALPIIAGTVIRLTVDHQPSRGEPKPLWLWWSKLDATPADVDRCWQAFLRRFDIEHTFRLLKQTLGWSAPKLREPAAADRWTWLILAAHTQLRLARPLAQDLRRPWERPLTAERLTPARVRRGLQNLRTTSASPARVPKPSKSGPGRPPGSRNRHTATRYDVGLILVTGRHTSDRLTTRRAPNPAALVKRQVEWLSLNLFPQVA
ncbi:NF041680 family putative transposase [Actinoplanes sp. CA-030573]|uniref:NF041680 family putative transposase n=1 Tax=Actinoplanes sp. CA-030573 TaxID=3239898 RepID=UPI003D8EFD9B